VLFELTSLIVPLGESEEGDGVAVASLAEEEVEDVVVSDEDDEVDKEGETDAAGVDGVLSGEGDALSMETPGARAALGGVAAPPGAAPATAFGFDMPKMCE
jgi:hypothetical protein